MKLRVLIAVACVAALSVPSAQASQLIDRNASGVRLEVNSKGVALLTYRAGGRFHHVLAWGAINAHRPSETRRQVAFHLDYSGGWGVFRRAAWKTFQNSCTPVRVPLHWLITACRASDGSLWAVQSWQRTLPNYGVAPSSWLQSAWELRLSHWTGPLPELTVRFGW